MGSRANINISDASVSKLGKALRKHKFLRIMKNNAYVYAVNLLEYEEVDKENKNNGIPTIPPPEQQKIPFRFEN